MTRLSLAVVALLMSPAAAIATPVLNAPPADSISADRPLLSWAFPTPDERVSALTVATDPARTPVGEFYDEHRVAGGVLDELATSWQDTSRTPAGTYWWNLYWHLEDYSASGYTDPATFTIPAYVRGVRVGVRQYNSIPDATISASYVANVRTVRVECRVYVGVRRVAGAVRLVTYGAIGERATASCDLRVPERLDGSRLRAVVVVKAAGKSASAARSFRAS